MPGPVRIHHVNFIVRDLDAAIERFSGKLGLGPFSVVDHAARGARIARTQVGESWFVLVSPYDEDSAPGRYLAEHGEGFFLLSFGVEDLERALAAVGSADAPRSGIDDWRIADIGDWFGAQLQLTSDSEPADDRA